MKVILDRQDNNYHFIAKNEEGNSISIDGSPDIGGGNKGVRPMQLLLMGIGGCSGIDVVLILKKQKQVIDALTIEIEGNKEQMDGYSLFKTIKLNFIFKGNLDNAKVKRAIDLSLDKYCSVAKTLEKTANITYTYTIN